VAAAFILSEHHSHCHPEPVLWAKDPCSSLFPVRRDKLPRSFAPMKCIGAQDDSALRASVLFRGVPPIRRGGHFMSATVKKPEQATDRTQ
jgi:hypothetical protein